MKTLMLLLIAMLLGSIAIAQTGTITPKRKPGGIKFYRAGEVIKNAEMKQALKINADALKLYKKGRTEMTISTVTGVTGGVLLGWGLGQVSDEIEWEFLAIGASVGLVSVLVFEGGVKKAEEAIHMYNKGLPYTSIHSRTELRVVSNRNGFGLSFGF